MLTENEIKFLIKELNWKESESKIIKKGVITYKVRLLNNDKIEILDHDLFLEDNHEYDLTGK